MKKIIGTFALTIITLITLNAQDSIEGIWYNTTKTGKVKIFKSGDKYYGNIIWIDDLIDENTGKPKTDLYNPDSDKHNDPIIGLQVLKGFEADGDGKFSGGTIYDPENGKTYKSKMTLQDKNNLDVRGYIGLPAFGRTENWTRTTK